MSRRARRWLVAGSAVIGFLILIPIFQFNIFGTAEKSFFDDWQRDSQALVLGNIARDATDAPSSAYGLWVEEPDQEGVYATLESGAESTQSSADYAIYDRQLGLQGRLFAAIYSVPACSSLTCVQTVSSGLTAATLIIFMLLLWRISRFSFALVTLVTVASSPWMVAAARNLYWVPWTWFLPAIAASLLVLSHRWFTRAASIILMIAFFALRFATGYEFASSITLMAACVPLIAYLLGHRGSFGRSIIGAATACVAAVAAFAGVLFVDAKFRAGGDLSAGFTAILSDVSRRTYGPQVDGFDPNVNASLAANPIVVIGKYLFTWKTDFLRIGPDVFTQLRFGAPSLAILIVLAAAVLIARMVRRDGYWIRDLIVLIVTASVPVSWFVLGKAHSFVHININFVLWYLLFASALVWVVGSFIRELIPYGRYRSEPERYGD